MGARLYKRGKIWWVWYYDRKRACRRESSRCTDRKAAEAYLRRREAEAQGLTEAATGRPAYSLTEALEELLARHPWRQATLASAHSRAGQLARIVGSRDLAELTCAHLEAYVAQRQAERISDHTIHKELVLVRMALKLAKMQNRWDGDLEKIMPRHKAHYRPGERYLSIEELRLLLEHIAPPGPRFQRTRPRRALWVLICAYTGARKSEVGRLQWADIDWAAGLLRVRGTKTEGSDRTIPLAPELRAALEPLRPGPGEELERPIVGHWDHADLGIRQACARAGIPPASPVDLRRTCASWMALAGVPPLEIAKWLGHASLDMVLRVYARLAPEALRRAASTLPRLGTCEGYVKGIRENEGKLQKLSTAGEGSGNEKTPDFQGFSGRAWRESNPRPLASEDKPEVVNILNIQAKK